tara:strand:+ start:1030 stop:1221 length:192 start_codon:yes stop_codon:yes gene_type:complete
MATVVEESVNGLLKHPLFIVDDDVGRLKLEEILEAVVTVNDPTVEIVEITGREPAALKGNQGP